MPVSVDERSTTDVAAKERIAEVAVQFVPESGYVYFDAGTTILPLVHAWLKAGKHTCTAVTNDVAIAVVLAQHGAEHILLTGKIHPVTQSLSGAASQNQLGDFRFAACFISADGIERNGAVRCALAEEAMLKRLAIKNSDSRILLGASSKWDKQSNALIATLDAFDMWITETGTQDIKKSGT
jgi:DeoR family fructose operon transcriptional repressor